MSDSKNLIIAPSLLGADFSKLRSEVELCNDSKAEWLHLDIMDQQFVPNLSFGPAVVKSLRNQPAKMSVLFLRQKLEKSKLINFLQ